MKRPLFLIAVLAPVLFASAAEAAVRKCSPDEVSRNATWVDKVMLSVDGKVIGELPEKGAPANSASAFLEAIPQNELWLITVTCIEYDAESGRVASPGIAVVTKGGASRVAREYLSKLPSLQEAYRRNHGRYAENASHLFVRRIAVPIEMTANESGWKASIKWTPREGCSIAGDSSGVASEVSCGATE